MTIQCTLLTSDRSADNDSLLLRHGMYRLRHAIFCERLQWTPCRPDGIEVDRYDSLDPTYLVAHDERERVYGCWRILPSTGPYMLRDIFGHLLHGEAAPECDEVWEISRFAVDPRFAAPNSLGDASNVVGRMLKALLDVGAERGIDRYVAASDVRFERLLARAGLKTKRNGPPVRMRNSIAVAGWADVTPANAARIAARLADGDPGARRNRTSDGESIDIAA